MAYRFVFTAEKSGSDILELLFSIPGWQDVASCFAVDSPFVLLTESFSEDRSYVEFVAHFEDREMYELWHEVYAPLHDQSREDAMNFLETQGVVFNLYNEGIDLSGTSRSQPIEEFVSRFPEVL